MAFFSGSTYVSSKKGKTTGGGTITPYQLLLDREAVLKMKYADMFSGDILNNGYFIELQAEYEKALNDPNIKESERMDILTKMYSLNIEQQKWGITHQPIYQKTVEILKSDIDNDWATIWKDQNLLRSGNIGAMGELMLDSLDTTRGEIMDKLNQLQEVTDDEKTITPLKNLLDYIDGQMGFYRGISASPGEYAMVVDTTQNGQIKNLQVKNIFDTSEYEDTGQLVGGLRLYGKPHPNLTDKEGNEYIAIGNNTFVGNPTARMPFAFDPIKSGMPEFNMETLSNIPFGNYQQGDILKTSNDNYYIVKPDGRFIFYPSRLTAQGAGFDTTKASTITNEDSQAIERGYTVDHQLQTKMPETEVRDALGGLIMGLQTPMPIQSKPSELPSSLPQFQTKLPSKQKKWYEGTEGDPRQAFREMRQKATDIKMAREQKKTTPEKQQQLTQGIYQSRL